MRRSLLLFLLLAVTTATASANPHESLSFLTAVKGPLPNAQYFQVDSAKLWATFTGKRNLQLSDFPCGAGQRVTLEMQSMPSPVKASTQLWIGSKSGSTQVQMPPALAFKGKVLGEPHSRVVISIVGASFFVSIKHESGETYDLAPAKSAAHVDETPNLHLLMLETDLLSLGGTAPMDCRTDNLLQPHTPIPIDQLLPNSPSYEEGGGRGVVLTVPATLLETEIAVEADTCFSKAQGGSTANVVAYIVSMFAMSQVVYEEEANIVFSLPWIKIWTDTDPYNVNGNAYALPDTVKSYWKKHYTDVPRDLAHVMTSIGYGGGGYGWFSLCDTEWSYSVSSPQTKHNYPTYAFTYDAYIVAHEIGHNFGLEHSFKCYWNPPLDTCYTNDDTTWGLKLGDACYGLPIAPRPNPGTIMSYCANANYRLSNYDFSKYKLEMTFSPRVASVMRSNAEKAPCIEQPKEHRLVLLAPHGTETFPGDTTIQIRWSYAHVDSVLMRYSPDSGKTWTDIGRAPSAAGSYDWKLPNISSSKMLLTLVEPTQNQAFATDTSALFFAVTKSASVASAAGPTGIAFSLVSNAAENRVTLLPSFDCAALHYEIIDVLGNVLSTFTGAATTERGLPVDITSLKNGSYFLRITSPIKQVLKFESVR